MTVWVHELVKVGALGKVSTVRLAVEDDDPYLTSGEGVYTLDGTLLDAAPVVDVGRALGGWAGMTISTAAMHFELDGADYFMLPYQYEPDAVTTLEQTATYGEVGAIAYAGYGFTLDNGAMYQGDAFVLTYTEAVLEGTSVQKLTIFDDDPRFQTNGDNGFPDTEFGGDPIGVFGDQGSTRVVNISDAGTSNAEMALVNVGYTGPGGSGTFDAILWNFTFGSSRYLYFVPRDGSVDFAAVTDIDNYAFLDTAPSGELYSDFGLTVDRTAKSGTSAGETLMGDDDLGHDLLKGLGGNDILLGRHGQDRLEGGKGADTLYGGHNNDVLLGGGGNDVLLGGLGRDGLYGGKGKDRLEGGSDEDRLEDGLGKDKLFGGGEADTFVLVADGVTDRIKDFQDGLDKIDLTVGFGALVLTDIAPGKVKVQGGGDTLIVEDGQGLLTAADLSAADFI